MNKLALIFLLVFTTGLLITSCMSRDGAEKQHKKKFQNSEADYQSGFGDVIAIMKDYVTTKRFRPEPTFKLPVKPVFAEQLQQETQDVVYRLGHSSLLFKLSGKLVLADPVFSERASPFSWAGPKRFHPTPISLDELPAVDVVVISHDHYDHLDKESTIKLAAKVKRFLVPEKVGQYLADWGVNKDKITEFEWWESRRFSDIDFTFTPTQHFSGRGLFDRDSTLWGSWVINSGAKNLYFSGDTGYFSGFKEIGKRFGPFDATFIETGAYNEKWSQIHMFPEQSVQAHKDLNGGVMMPIHNSTFDLALHDWDEPLNRVHAAAAREGVELATPVIGQRIELGRPLSAAHKRQWWLEAENVKDDVLAAE